jgi:hypothetical protein
MLVKLMCEIWVAVAQAVVFTVVFVVLTLPLVAGAVLLYGVWR